MVVRRNVLFPFDLSLVRIIIVHFLRPTGCLSTGHLVVALVFGEVLAVAGSFLALLALRVVFATRAQRELPLVALEGFSRVSLEHMLLPLLLRPLQFAQFLLSLSLSSHLRQLRVHLFL